MCKFCQRMGYETTKITVEKFEETCPVYDKLFGKVQVGTITRKRQPLMRLDFRKRSYNCIPMPVEFKFCPHCGREINKGENTNEITGSN